MRFPSWKNQVNFLLWKFGRGYCRMAWFLFGSICIDFSLIMYSRKVISLRSNWHFLSLMVILCFCKVISIFWRCSLNFLVWQHKSSTQIFIHSLVSRSNIELIIAINTATELTSPKGHLLNWNWWFPNLNAVYRRLLSVNIAKDKSIFGKYSVPA